MGILSELLNVGYLNKKNIHQICNNVRSVWCQKARAHTWQCSTIILTSGMIWIEHDHILKFRITSTAPKCPSLSVLSGGEWDKSCCDLICRGVGGIPRGDFSFSKEKGKVGWGEESKGWYEVVKCINKCYNKIAWGFDT